MRIRECDNLKIEMQNTMTDTVDKFDSKSYLNMELLRFTTAGSVDDGKSERSDQEQCERKFLFHGAILIERTAVDQSPTAVLGDKLSSSLSSLFFSRRRLFLWLVAPGFPFRWK